MLAAILNSALQNQLVLGIKVRGPHTWSSPLQVPLCPHLFTSCREPPEREVIDSNSNGNLDPPSTLFILQIGTTYPLKQGTRSVLEYSRHSNNSSSDPCAPASGGLKITEPLKRACLNPCAQTLNLNLGRFEED